MTTLDERKLKPRFTMALFSLPETLIVSATCALLLTLSLAACASTGRRSLQLECADSLRHDGKGAFSYASDHGGLLPRGDLEPGQRWLSDYFLSLKDGNLLLHLSGYVQAEYFLCPAAPPNQDRKLRPVVQDEACSFIANAVLTDHLGKGGARLASVKKPAETVFFADRGTTQIGMEIVARFAGNGKHSFGRDRWEKAELLHDSRVNVLHCDGGVALSAEEEISRDASYGLAFDGTPLF